TFALSLPILLLLIGVIVQWALVANARLAINRAANAAARTAMTVLPTDPQLEPGGPPMVRRSALIVLAGLSPVSQEGATSDAQEVAQALENCGLTLPDRYDLRYTHADQATTLDIEPEGTQWGGWTELTHLHAPEAVITLTYKFRLTVPGAMFIGQHETVAGVEGYYLTMTAVRHVQLSDGREANSTIVAGGGT
ncbi:MAG TPA: TadE/TadG family type IV pilus assembly protein, partial [Phycisphaerae bacterium]|nr:TadE/TadG family type IV pilus assembly protein [Phycisphaerae bacterium]